MATIIWEGGAAEIAQVDELTPGGTIEADDRFIVTVGGKSVNVAAGGTTVADVTAAVEAAWNASTEPEHQEITAVDQTTYISMTADTAGVPFDMTVSTTEAGGGAADDQTFVNTSDGTGNSVLNSSPNDGNVLTNWSGGALPTGSDDIVFGNSTVDLLYGLDAIGDVTGCVIDSTYTGRIGLPRNNANGYVEYRTRFLQLGTGLATLDVGQGQATGSGRMNLAIGNRSADTAINVYQTGTAIETGIPALLLTTGTQSADTTLTVNRGDVGIAAGAGETAVIDTLTMGYIDRITSDATVTVGSGVTLTTINKSGGEATIATNVTTATQTDGTLTINGTATLTTLNLDGGTIYYSTSGTLTTAVVSSAAIFSCVRDGRSRTITNMAIHSGGAILDPLASITFTNGIDITRAKLSEVSIDLGEHFTISITAI